jgi:CheY-like chemotaxis protein
VTGTDKNARVEQRDRRARGKGKSAAEPGGRARTASGVGAPTAGIRFANRGSENKVRPMSPTETSAAGREAPPKDAILLVDDERPLLDMYIAALSSWFDVSTAANVVDAERLLQERTFKVVVADNVMPGESGVTLLARVRQKYPRTQRLLVAGYLKPEMLLRSVSEAGVFRTLTKPVPVAELVRVLQEAVRAYDDEPARD